MFGNVGWGEVLIILAAGLIILGPERLPGAVSWTLKSVRQARDYATGATSQLRDELGPEFDDLRKPLADLNELRGMTPTGFVTKHLFDGDSSFLSSNTYLSDTAEPSAPKLTKAAADGAGGKAAGGKVADDSPAVDMAKRVPPSSDRPAEQTTRRHDIADWDAT